jgi:hypothetical protein
VTILTGFCPNIKRLFTTICGRGRKKDKPKITERKETAVEEMVRIKVIHDIAPYDTSFEQTVKSELKGSACIGSFIIITGNLSVGSYYFFCG